MHLNTDAWGYILNYITLFYFSQLRQWFTYKTEQWNDHTLKYKGHRQKSKAQMLLKLENNKTLNSA